MESRCDNHSNLAFIRQGIQDLIAGCHRRFYFPARPDLLAGCNGGDDGHIYVDVIDPDLAAQKQHSTPATGFRVLIG